MKESIFAEFQYFIRRIKAHQAGHKLQNGETIEDLEDRFRIQVENGLAISDPDSQEVAMDILLSDLSEKDQKEHLITLRRTGKSSFKPKEKRSTLQKPTQPVSLQQQREKALDLIAKALKEAGVRFQKQPLGVKMLMAEFELKNVDYNDPKDLKLLFVNTIRMSGHAKKANPLELAGIFNKLLG